MLAAAQRPLSPDAFSRRLAPPRSFRTAAGGRDSDGRGCWFWAALLAPCLAACGCGEAPQTPPTAVTPEVEVSLPVTRQIVDHEDFTGRIEAVKSIEIRARVSGYLEKVCFREGFDVKEGDTLFLIDPRTYQADYDRAVANLAQAKAHLVRTDADYRRAADLLPSKSISQAEYDQAFGDRSEAEAAVKVAEAAQHTAKLNLDFTVVTSPLTGRISRQNIDPGNMVMADNTILTTLVTLDPVYAYFDVDERATLRFRRLLEAGKVKSAREGKSPVFLGLADEGDQYPHEGMINFVDNRLDPSTGTLRLRGLFDNHKQFLAPGMFVRVRVPIGQPHPAILATERAIGSDQGQKFIYVLNDKNEILYREVQIGAFENGLRVIESGLALGERFVVNGLQKVKQGVTVRAKLVESPAPEKAKSAGELVLDSAHGGGRSAPAAAPPVLKKEGKLP